MVQTFLTESLATVFEMQKSAIKNGTRVQVAYDHPVFEAFPDELERIGELALDLGVNVTDTGYTYSLRKTDDGKLYVDSLLVAKDKDGQPCLVWGNLRLPLAGLPSDVFLELREKDGRTLVYLETKTFEFYIPLALKTEKGTDGKRVYPKFDDVAKAFRKGNLSEYLADNTGKTVSLGQAMADGTLKPGQYTVTGYRKLPFLSDKGQPKFAITIADHGVFNCNAAINSKLAGEPAVSADKPATLNLIKFVGAAPSGNGYVIEAELITQRDREVPLFTW